MRQIYRTPAPVLRLTWVALVALTLLSARLGGQHPPQELAIKLEAVKNTVDGSALRGCLVRGDAGPGKRQEIWMAFGAVKPRTEVGWEPVATRAECGVGTFDKVGASIFQIFGTPYLVVDLNAVPSIVTGKWLMTASLTVRKLSGFDANRRPVYTTRTQQRALDVSSNPEALIPVLFADSHEQSAFGINELLFHIQADVVAVRPSMTYGSVSVRTELPGLNVYLDGGFVGRTGEGPLLIKNVMVGTREIRAEDFSGREAHATVAVEDVDSPVDVALNVVNLPTESGGLASIGKNREPSAR